VTEPLVRVLIPVVPASNCDEPKLWTCRFRAAPNEPGRGIIFVSRNENQKKIFQDVAHALRGLEAERPLGKVPECFLGCVEVTEAKQRQTKGESSMLGAAAGFIAARALNPAALCPLVATGALDFPDLRGDLNKRLGECVDIQPVAGLAPKLAAALKAERPWGKLLVVLPAGTHPDDEKDFEEIERSIAELTSRGDAVLRAERLDQVLAAWAPAEAWVTRELAAEYAGVVVPAQGSEDTTSAKLGSTRSLPWRLRSPWIVAGGGAAALLALFSWSLLHLKTPEPDEAAAVRIIAAPDTRCDLDAPQIDSGRSGNQQAAAAACRALTACDAASGHPLDPDRQARGLTGGIGLTFLAQPSRSATAREACEVAVHLAPNSSKAPWHLSRVLEAQGEVAAAARLREQAARDGDPMARLRLAQGLLADGEAGAAREQIRLLAERAEPVPEAVYWQAWLFGCGVGGPRDGPASAALGLRLVDLARSYPGVPDFVDRARSLADALAAPAGSEPESPTWCNTFHP